MGDSWNTSTGLTELVPNFVGSRMWLLMSDNGMTIFDLSFDLSEILGIFCTVVCGMNGTQGAQQWLCVLP